MLPMVSRSLLTIKKELKKKTKIEAEVLGIALP